MVATVCRLLSSLFDLADAVTYVQDPRPKTFLEHAKGISKVVAWSASACESAGVGIGLSNSTLGKVKFVEQVALGAHLNFNLFEMITENTSDVESFEKKLFAPGLSYLRSCSQLNAYEERTTLDTLPKDNAQRAESSTKATADLIAAETDTARFGVAELALKAGIIGGLGDLYSAWNHATSRVYLGALRDMDHPDLNYRNLLALDFIPQALHHDPILSRHICPITNHPIRFIVGDPDGITFYERSEIMRIINEDGISPATRQPLIASQLVTRADLQQQIDSRLAFHERQNRDAHRQRL